jgi:hypothetical protein
MGEDRPLGRGTYNVLWGGFLVLFPLALFRVLGMEPPNYPQIWQCVGMIVGIYGVGYAAAALAPLRHWPVVLAGLLGKILGPIAFLSAGVGVRFLSPFPSPSSSFGPTKPTERCERRTREPPRYAGRQCTSPLLETPQTSWKEPLGA